MATRTTWYPATLGEEKIRRLEDELYRARRAIIGFAPNNLQSILWNYTNPEDRRASYSWEGEAADQIIDHAKVLTKEEGSYLQPRAYCPLCGDGSTSPYESGFTVPEGLRRHLVGWGNTHQCEVMVAVMALGRNYWNDKFSEEEEAKEIEMSDRKVQRKKTETLYLTAPDLEAQLIDDGNHFGSVARTEEELVWAEDRLSALGFQLSHEGNIKSYTSERDAFVVYADPRTKGEITFTAFKKPLPMRSRIPRVRTYAFRFFRLKDSWKNDIRAKYEIRLSAVTKK